MQATVVLTIALLVLGSSSPAQAQTKTLLLMIRATEELMKQLVDLQARLAESVTHIYDAAETFTSDAMASMNQTMQELQHNIDELREKYADSIYDECFPARPIASFLNHSSDGVSKCANCAINRTLTNAASIQTEIKTLYKMAEEIPIELNQCGKQVGCVLTLIGRVSEFSASAVKLSMAVADTTLFVATIHDTFIPCVAMKGQFDKWAVDSIGNITSCLTSHTSEA